MVRTTADHQHDFFDLDRRDVFSLVFRGLGGDVMVERALTDLPGGVAGATLAVMLALFLLGFVMDAFEIIFVVVPIVAPVLLKMPGVDPVWLGIMMAVNLQTSYMHPPLGPTLFYLRGVAPPEITTRHIYLGIIPYVLIQLAMLVALWFLPGARDLAAAPALRTLKSESASRRRVPKRREAGPRPGFPRHNRTQQKPGGCPQSGCCSLAADFHVHAWHAQPNRGRRGTIVVDDDAVFMLDALLDARAAVAHLATDPVSARHLGERKQTGTGDDLDQRDVPHGFLQMNWRGNPRHDLRSGANKAEDKLTAGTDKPERSSAERNGPGRYHAGGAGSCRRSVSQGSGRVIHAVTVGHSLRIRQCIVKNDHPEQSGERVKRHGHPDAHGQFLFHRAARLESRPECNHSNPAHAECSGKSRRTISRKLFWKD